MEQPDRVEAELRTFLIADIRGYTAYTRDNGADAAADLVTQFAAIVRDVVAAHDGFLLELRGDEALAVFVLARAALRAALELQVRFAAELDRGVGIGLDAGEAIPVEGGYRGSALNVAARLCAQARAGETLASEAVIHLAAKVDGIGYADARTYRLKGMDDPVRAVHVVPADKGSSKPIRYKGEGQTVSRRALVAGGVLLLAIVVAVAVIIFTLTRPAAKVAFIRRGGSEIDSALQTSFDRAVADFKFVGTNRLDGDTGGTESLEQVSRDGNQLVVTYSMDIDAFNGVVRTFPTTQYVLLDELGAEPNVSYVAFDDQESSYLAGAAAALKSQTGTIGFIGGVDFDKIWRFAAGYEAGAKSIKPNISVFSTYLTEPPDLSGFVSQDAGRDAAEAMFRDGADVVFAAAGNSGYGAMDAAASLSPTLDRQLWVIGADDDQYDEIVGLPGLVDPSAWQAHILTSVVKRWDNAMYTVLSDFAGGKLASGLIEIRLDSGGVDITYTGGFLDQQKPQLDQIRSQIIGGQIAVPCVPADKVEQSAASGQSPLCRR